MTMTIRLSCRIPKTADKELDRITARRKARKGRTIAYLMDLALKSPDFTIMKFEGDSAQSCTYNPTEEWLNSFDDYRAKHGLPTNTEFFKNALLRGMSIELTKNPLPTM